MFKKRKNHDLFSDIDKRIKNSIIFPTKSRPRNNLSKRKILDDIDIIKIDLDEISLDPIPKEKRLRQKLIEKPLLTGRLSSRCRGFTMEEKQRILFIRQKRLKFYGLSV
jgi:hypothetical protein